MMVAPASTAGASSSSSSTGTSPRAAEGRSASPRATPDDAITFDEVAVGTWVTDEYADRGVVTTTDVQTTWDDDSPTEPVLAGDPKFFGDVGISFVEPGTTNPTTVNGFTLDVGYIDDRDSVEIEYYDASGAVVGAVRAQSYGINTIDITYRGVAGFTVSAVAYEAAGFGIDNLVIERGASGVDPVRMASFGDSYSSGEGLVPEDGLRYDCGTDLRKFAYQQDTTVPPFYRWRRGIDCDTRTGFTDPPADLFSRPTVVHENKCHRHRRAFHNQIRERLGIAGSDAIFVACSMATTEHVGLRDKQSSQFPRSPWGVHGGKTQIENVRDFDDQGAPDLITIGIGGNDAGFGEIISRCLLHDCDTDETFKDGIISRINGTTFRNIRETLTKLRDDDQYPAATIVAFGYPGVIGDPATDCAGFGTFVSIGEEERRWIKDEVLPAINSAVADAAAEAGVLFADVSQVTAGHEICADDEWVNGIRLGDDAYGVFGHESFHPNQRAHDAIASYFIDRFTDGSGRLLRSNPAPSEPLRPETGPTIYLGTLEAGATEPCGADCLQPAACVQACSIHLQGSNFAPDSELRVTLHSDPVDLGTVRTDDQGRLSADLRLPDGVAPGPHGVQLSGETADGEHQYGTAFVQVYETHPGPWREGLLPPEPPAPPVVTPRRVAARVSGLRWRGRRLLGRVQCAAAAASTCRVRFTLSRPAPRGRRRTVGKTLLSVRAGRTRALSIRLRGRRSIRRRLRLTVQTRTSAGLVTRRMSLARVRG